MSQELEAFGYCPACGRRGTLAVSGGKRIRCGDCGFLYFHNVAIAVALLLRVGDAILLTRRARPPSEGLLDFPGGFVDPGETLEQALVREVGEELGLTIAPDALCYRFSGHNRYPYAGVGYRTADAYFELELAERPQLCCADDVAAAEWHRLNALPRQELAFPTVERALGVLQEQTR